MAIYLDANVFPERGSLPSLELATLIALANETKLAVCIPELVAEEAMSRYYRGLLAAQSKLLAAADEVGNYWDVPSIYIPDSRELLAIRRKELERLGTVLPIDPLDTREGMIREVWRRLPAREGKGGRDAAIWNSIKRHHVSLQETSYFVSRNTKDFASTGGDVWASDLAQELAGYDHPLIYIHSPEKLFETLATAAPVTLDASQISGADSVVEAVAKFVVDNQIYASGAVGENFSGVNFLAAPVSAVLKSMQQVQSYNVAGTIVAVAWTDWHIECRVGVMRQFVRRTYGQSFYLASGDCRLQLLFRIDEGTGVPISVEVTNSRECRLTAGPFEYGASV